VTSYSLSHLSDHTLLRDLAALLARDRVTTAELLAHIAEVDARQLYLPAAYPSMYAYCVGELHLGEQAAFKRIRAARTARQFPAVFEALALGRLHLSAVVLLAPYLTSENTHELLAAATHKTSLQVEHLIAARFPRLDVPVLVQAVVETPTPTTSPLPADAPGDVPALSSRTVAGMALGQVAVPSLRPTLAPLAAERYALQCTISQSTHDKLRYAQALMGHQLPSGDIAAVLDRALDALLPQLEQRKFAATIRPRPRHGRGTTRARHVPAHVKRTVWERDQGQCTFVSETGRRCPARTHLEFDHVHEVARGGEASVAGIRLRCRAHNQYQAECTFGAEFMRRKRRAAAETRAAAKGRPTEARAAAKAHASVRAREQAAAAERARELDVVPWLRRLGFSASEARQAAARCESMPDASLEERVRAALSLFGGRTTRGGRAVAGAEAATRGHEARVPAAFQVGSGRDL
jgi:hypothetical protein